MITAKNRGLISVLALLFLTMFATLAIAYAEMTNNHVQQAKNLTYVQAARMEAEGGLSFIRYQLGQLSLTGGTANLLSNLSTQLGKAINGTANLGGATVSFANNQVTVPTITTDKSGRNFSTTVTLQNSLLVVQVIGRANNLSRTVSMSFKPAIGRSAVLDYGIATKSAVVLTGNASVRGANSAAESNILSATYTTDDAFDLTGNCNIQGDIYASNPAAYATMTGNITIGGQSSRNAGISDHIHLGIGAVDFPEVDPTVFEPFATTIVDKKTSLSGNKTFSNIRIKAGTNPSFSGNITLKGVIYIEAPNNVTFTGNLNLTGVIVTQDAGDNAYATNTIKFAGNTSVQGVENLPDTSDFHTLRQMPGSFLLAPGFGVAFTGNFGTVSGCMAADSYSFTGNAGGTVHGPIINYSDSAFTLTGNSQIIIDRKGSPDTPPGLSAPTKFTPDPTSYVEL